MGTPEHNPRWPEHHDHDCIRRERTSCDCTATDEWYARREAEARSTR